MKSFVSTTALTALTFGLIFAATPSFATQIDSPVSGVVVNQNSPHYIVTIDCDSLPFGGQELFTGRTQRGSYTLNFGSSCQDSGVYTMEVDDNGDTDEVGGYTVGRTHLNSSPGAIGIPATMTLDPDTYVTIFKNADNDFFNVRYNGSDENQTTPDPTTNTLANTGLETGYITLLAFSFLLLGLAFRNVSRKRKRR